MGIMYKSMMLSLQLQASTGTDASDLVSEGGGCGNGGGGLQVVRLGGVYYRWASQRTEASISMQEHKHSAIATLPFSRFRCSLVFQPRLKTNRTSTKCRGHRDTFTVSKLT